MKINENQWNQRKSTKIDKIKKHLWNLSNSTNFNANWFSFFIFKFRWLFWRSRPRPYGILSARRGVLSHPPTPPSPSPSWPRLGANKKQPYVPWWRHQSWAFLRQGELQCPYLLVHRNARPSSRTWCLMCATVEKIEPLLGPPLSTLQWSFNDPRMTL